MKPRDSLRRVILETLGDPPISTLSADLLRQWVSKRQGAGKSASTINKGLITLQAMTARLVELDELPPEALTSVRKVKKLPERNDRVRALTDDERSRLMAAFEDLSRREPLRDLVVAAMTTGARLGELVSLRVGDVDLKKGMITFRRTKTAILSTVPIHPALAEILARLCADKEPDAHVFTSTRGPWTTWGVASSFKKACDRAGIEDFHFHDLRHDAATQMLNTGASLTEVAAMLGHSTKTGLKMTLRYAHLQPSTLAAPISRIQVPSHNTSHYAKTREPK